MALSRETKTILTWFLTPVAATVAGGIIGHAVIKGDKGYGWKAGAGVGLVAGILGAVGINEAVTKYPDPIPPPPKTAGGLAVVTAHPAPTS